jgi:hypothetical protein
LGCEVDHIISEKHGGQTTEQNLAFACVFCNQAKGSDVGSIIHGTGDFVRFYNPRSDPWGEHFRLIDYRIDALTNIGAATSLILQFNKLERLLERQALSLISRYPTAFASTRMIMKQ